MITPESAEIMRLLGMGAGELELPGRFSMFNEVFNYFGKQSSANARQDILRVVMKNPSKDALTAAWQYVRLNNERMGALKELIELEQEQPYDETISQELHEGILTMNAIKKMKDDIQKVKGQQIQKDIFERKATENQEEAGYRNAVAKATTLDKVSHQLNIVEEINGALAYYNG